MQEACINCNGTVGMASPHALGLWDGEAYKGGICPTCLRHPHRLKRHVCTAVERYAPPRRRT